MFKLLLNNPHALSRSPTLFGYTMVKRTISTLEERETTSTVRRSTRVTKKAKIVASESDQVIEQSEIALGVSLDSFYIHFN